MFDKLEDLLMRFEDIMVELSSPGVTDDPKRFRDLMKEQSDLTPIVEAYKKYTKAKQDIEDSLSMLESAPIWQSTAKCRLDSPSTQNSGTNCIHLRN